MLNTKQFPDKNNKSCMKSTDCDTDTT